MQSVTWYFQHAEAVSHLAHPVSSCDAKLQTLWGKEHIEKQDFSYSFQIPIQQAGENV